jgi:hypothetical protein
MRYLDPTISDYSKAISAGIGAAHVYAERIQFDNERGEQAERAVVVCQCKVALESGDLLWHELPSWVQLVIQGEHHVRGWVDGDGFVAPAPAADHRLSSHAERKLTRKRRQVLEKRQQGQERADSRSMQKLEQLVEAWGARVRGNIAPLRRR